MRWPLRDGGSCISAHVKRAIDANAAKYSAELRAKLTDPTLAQTLFNQLLAPIQNYANKKELVIIPDGQLHLLPFSALVNKDAYVLSSHTVDVAPSSTAFEILRRQSEEKERVEMPYIGVAAWTQAQTLAIRSCVQLAAPNEVNLYRCRTVKLKSKRLPTICPAPTRFFLAPMQQRRDLRNYRLRVRRSSILLFMVMRISTTPTVRR